MFHQGSTTNTLWVPAMNLTTTQITRMGMALAICAAAYKLIDNGAVKTAAVAVAAVIVAKQVPYVQDALV